MRKATLFQARETARETDTQFGEFYFDKILKEIQSEHSRKFPYNHDYQRLNQIQFYLDENERIEAKPGDAVTTKITTTYLENILYFATVWTSYRAAQLKIGTPEFAEFKNVVFDFHLEYEKLILEQEKIYLGEKLKEAQAEFETRGDDLDEQSERAANINDINIKIEKTNDALRKLEGISIDYDYHNLMGLKNKLASEINEAIENDKDPLIETENTFRFLDTLLNEFDKKFDAMCTDAKKTEWQSLMFDMYQNDQSRTHDPRDFVEFVLEQGKNYLPEHYMPFELADKKFPSSDANAELSHLDSRGGKRLLAITPPIKSVAVDPTEKAKINLKTLNQFLETLTSQRIRQIIALDDSEAILDYSEIVKQLGITIIKIKVGDNQPLNFDSKTVGALLAAHANYEIAIPTAAHCFSSVGRTGQVRLLFALMDRYNNHSGDMDFHLACNSISNLSLQKKLDDDQAELLNEYLTTFFNRASEALCSLRQTRYCIQTDAQFVNTLPLLLCMIASTPEKREQLQRRFSNESTQEKKTVVLGRTDSNTSYASLESEDAESEKVSRTSSDTPFSRLSSFKKPIPDVQVEKSDSNTSSPVEKSSLPRSQHSLTAHLGSLSPRTPRTPIVGFTDEEGFPSRPAQPKNSRPTTPRQSHSRSSSGEDQMNVSCESVFSNH